MKTWAHSPNQSLQSHTIQTARSLMRYAVRLVPAAASPAMRQWFQFEPRRIKWDWRTSRLRGTRAAARDVSAKKEKGGQSMGTCSNLTYKKPKKRWWKLNSYRNLQDLPHCKEAEEVQPRGNRTINWMMFWNWCSAHRPQQYLHHQINIWQTDRVSEEAQ